MTVVPAVALRPVEIAYGLAVGRDPSTPVLARSGDRTPRRALEDVLLVALRRPPCLLSFSGGRDSSALLMSISVSIPPSVFSPAHIIAPLGKMALDIT